MNEQLGLSTFVRNEEHSLPGLLEEALPYFDEIVVLDTGSDDGTWDYLRGMERQWAYQVRAYRLNIPLEPGYFHFGYVRSIAAHLNRCDYVVMLDADERIEGKDLWKIRNKWFPKAVEEDWYAMSFPRYNWTGSPVDQGDFDEDAYPDWQTRFIKNNGSVWWRRPVHEIIRYGPRSLDVNTVGIPDVHIHHYHDHFKKNKDLFEDRNAFYQKLAASDREWMDSYTFDLLPKDPERRLTIIELYKDVFGRVPKDEEIEPWLNAEMGTSEIRAELLDSEEYRANRGQHK